jgi:hypothetical protein
MLIPSILWILDQYRAQQKPSAKAEAKTPEPELSLGTAVSMEESSALQQIEKEIAAAAGLLRPLLPPQSGWTQTGTKELINAVTKFEKAREARVVDVFE